MSNITMPVKGDLISMNLGLPYVAGIENTYRVLKVDGNVAEVMAMFEAAGGIVFGSDNTYNGSNLDNYLSGLYSDLSDEIKTAIQSTNITQYKYSYSSNSYDASTHASYADWPSKASVGSMDRYIYAIDVADIETYFGSTSYMIAGGFSTSDILTMFWNTTNTPSTITRPCLRSADASGSNFVWIVDGDGGLVNNYHISDRRSARPAFRIDLSQVAFTTYDSLAGTTWYFNETPDMSTDVYRKINFTYSNSSNTYKSFWLGTDSITQERVINYSSTRAYKPTGWLDSNYRKVTFIDGIDIANSEFISWLEANATRISPAPVTSYTITYNLNGGTATNPSSYKASQLPISLNAPTRSGYTFKGWTGSNGDTPQTSVTIVSGTTGNLSYVANWEVIPETTYTITYVLNGGTVSGNPASYKASELPIAISNPTRNGYTFKGWTTNQSSTMTTGLVIPIGTTGNLTITAHWEQITSDTILAICKTQSGTFVNLPTPSEMKITDELVWASNTGRNSSGTMVGDLKGFKATVECKWNTITRSDMQKIRDNVLAGGSFFYLKYYDLGSTQKMHCYASGIPRQLYSVADGLEYYQDITISFIQK